MCIYVRLDRRDQVRSSKYEVRSCGVARVILLTSNFELLTSNLILIPPPLPQRLPAGLITLLGNLGQHREGDFRRSAAAKIEADWRMNRVNAFVRHAMFAEHVVDEDRLAAAAEQTDVLH